MKILVADKLAESGIERLRQHEHEVAVRPDLTGDELIDALRETEPAVLVVRSTKVPEPAIAASPSLELIVRAGAGYDNIDVQAASARGVFVSNCPGKNAAAVAELTIGLLLALDRTIPDNVIEARNGRWEKGRFSKASGLKGRTLGVIGLGGIGTLVVKLGLSLNMRVVAWSRSLTDERAAELGIERREDPLAVAAASDYVTLHVAATPDTKQLAGREFFERMKEGAGFINTTRGSVVDEAALRWAVENRGIRAALDVVENEPAGKSGDFSHPLAQVEGVYITHHIGASTQQAQDETAIEAARIVNVYNETGRVENCVNLADQSPATMLLAVRHLDRVGVLASVLDEIRKADWNVQEMENLVFAGAQAACARIQVDGREDQSVVDRIRDLDNILAVSLLTP